LVFPSRLSFVRRVVEDYETPESDFRFGPYATDMLTYRSNSVVEYVTPAGAEGLGTMLGMKTSDRPTQGVAILTGETPDLLHLVVRMPDDLSRSTPVIVLQFERDAARFRK
jgi:hypothetical protein